MLTYVFALMHVTGSELPQPAPLSHTTNETSHVDAELAQTGLPIQELSSFCWPVYLSSN